MNDFINCRSLQLFAEEAAAPESGVTEADAQPQSEPPAGDPGEFEKLIKGPYKQAYDARVKGIVQQRLKSARQTLEAFQALEPTLKLLRDHYGVAEGDYAGLEKAIGESCRPMDPAERQRQAHKEFQSSRRHCKFDAYSQSPPHHGHVWPSVHPPTVGGNPADGH